MKPTTLNKNSNRSPVYIDGILAFHNGIVCAGGDLIRGGRGYARKLYSVVLGQRDG